MINIRSAHIKRLLNIAWRIENRSFNKEAGAIRAFIAVSRYCLLAALFGYLFGIEAAGVMGLAIGLTGLVEEFVADRGDKLAALIGMSLVALGSAGCGPGAIYLMSGHIALAGILAIDGSGVFFDGLGFVIGTILMIVHERSLLEITCELFRFDIGARPDGSYGVL